ncbi:NAD(P)H-dependent oxidoreductase [Chitinophaga nivalis]|uniref:NAD(P)H-dependent oxidoreductase n=1 Tax=Chitinophaga nivalis TaxID=2991709 RepID=A0ABT3IR17_9BACT|nr:NAD(P)H-dependent oxidoreductase [Chitinophaga nivalis]MCW3463903.1 NAD(P)H-dependent oxidoreductase [Chitinophaga nivalis]MCW3486407.1 NAD(P)H-dependent oxidoreductase [Chitinophaga nivalis]
MKQQLTGGRPKIVIINGHPDTESYNFALHAAYKKGALSTGAEVREVTLAHLQFNPNLQHGYRKRMELEPDLLAAWENIVWADHMVWIYPLWWGGMPALLKGFLDRLFLPGMAFKLKNKHTIIGLLAGKTARIISTMDYPAWYYKWFIRQTGTRVVKKMILSYCGIKTTGVTYISPIMDSTPAFREKNITMVEKMGSNWK